MRTGVASAFLSMEASQRLKVFRVHPVLEAKSSENAAEGWLRESTSNQTSRKKL
jgi:hypothetical protein